MVRVIYNRYPAQKCRLHKICDNLRTTTYGAQDVQTYCEPDPERSQCAHRRLYNELYGIVRMRSLETKVKHLRYDVQFSRLREKRPAQFVCPS